MTEIERLCNNQPYTVVIRNNDTSLNTELRWLIDNFGDPIDVPGDGNFWGGIISDNSDSDVQEIHYFFLRENDAIMFKLAMT